MDYEKAYKQLVEDFGVILNLNTVKESGVISVEDVRKLIPELAESEDERIRIFLHHTFTAQYLCKDKLGKWHGEPVVNILAWLEEQGEHANFRNKIQIGDKVTRNQDGILVNLSQLNRVAKKDEEQGEQKLADKVEPKFKVGDWVVSKFDGKARQISEVHCDEYNNYYIVKGNEYNIEEYDRLHLLWTIQDAKDGDVLSYRDGQWIFIYKGIVNEDTFKYYALLSEIGITVNDAAFSLLSSCITPATKEQRALLFQKMKEAGYEWDSEKKELKKIEHNAWSEEDEYLLDETIKHLESLIRITKKQGSAYSDKIQYYQRDIDWLKSLRPQSTWKPSEEHIHWLKWAINRMPDTEIANEAEAELRDLLEQLEKLMEE